MARSPGKRKKPRGPRSPLWLPLAGLGFLVLVLFSRSLDSGFVYDSIGEIGQWGFLHDPGNLLNVLTFRVMSLDVLDFNRPVELASFMFDSLIWGTNPFGYHLTSIVLHAGVACLVFLGARHVLTLGKNAAPAGDWTTFSAFLAALFFAVHPIVTETLCEPSNRKDILAALFGLGAFLVVVRHRPGRTKGDILRIFLGCLLCLLSIGSKEVGIAFPALLFLYWLLFWRGESTLYWACVLAGTTLTVALFLLARFKLAHHPSEIFVHDPTYPGGSFLQALLIQPRIFVFYLGDLFWPFHLCSDENGYTIRNLLLAPSLLLLAGVVCALTWWAIKDSRVLFALGLLFASLLPVSNFIPIYHPMADRYLYVPLVGVALLLAIALQSRWITDKIFARKSASAVILLLTLFLSVLTWEREITWSNRISLWTDTIQKNPSSYSANINLPEALLVAGRLQEAKVSYENTLRTSYKSTPLPWFGYAIVLHRLGDIPGSREAARQALLLQPDLAVDKPDPLLEFDPVLRHEFTLIPVSPPGAP